MQVAEQDARPARTRSAIAAMAGTTLEYFDFQNYGLAAALVFGKLFFPHMSPALALLSSFATYGTGFLARPVGALFFGSMGDKYGRKPVLVSTIALMGIATTLTGCLPTYDQAGMLAPALLIMLRLLQGFGAGAELAGAAVLLSEFATPRNRGLMGSFAAIGTNAGTLLAAGTWALLALLPNSELLAWGWRVPFLASILVFASALIIRTRLSETPVFSGTQTPQLQQRKRPVSELLHGGRRAFFIGLGLRIGESGPSYLVQAFLIGYIASGLGMARGVGTTALLIASVLGFATIPFAGWLSDKVGRRLVYRMCSLFLVLFSFPAWALLQTKSAWAVGVVIVLSLNLGILPLFSVQSAYLAELFGSRYRYTALSLSKEVGAIASGGTAPIIASALLLWFHHAWWPVATYMALFALITFITTFIAPETKGRDLELEEDAV